VLDAGFKPVIVAIHAKPTQALDNTLDRFERIGRPVSIEAMAHMQAGLPEGLAAISGRFGEEAVELRVIDRSKFNEPNLSIGWEHLYTLKREGNRGTIRQQLEKHLERRRPEISDTAWRQASGHLPERENKSRNGASPPEHDSSERSATAGRSGEATVLEALQKELEDVLGAHAGKAPLLAKEKTWLNVSFNDKTKAKAFGAKWDREEKRWYAPEGANLNALGQWLSSQDKAPAVKSVLNPLEEFRQTLLAAGLRLETNPIMDGKIHRVPVENGRPGAKDGAYCGFEEANRPNGWYQNHKSGERGKWLATGQIISSGTKAEFKREISELLHEAAQVRRAEQEQAQKRAYAKWMNGEPVQAHSYLERKGVDNLGLRQVRSGTLIVPGYNLETGRIQTVQYINLDGEKWFEHGCPKSGAVCMLPPEKENKEKQDKKEPEIVLIAEGYATGASLHMATGLPVAHCCLIKVAEKAARRASWWYNDVRKRSYKPKRSEPWPIMTPSSSN
jgi:hypothetical protein